MNEEEKTISAAEPANEKQTKPTKPKRTDTEKLKECYEQKKRLLEQQTAARKKGKDIDKRISDNNAKITELENKELLKILKEKKISTQELIAFLKEIPEGITLANVVNTTFSKSQSHSEQLHL